MLGIILTDLAPQVGKEAHLTTSPSATLLPSLVRRNLCPIQASTGLI